VRAQPLREPIGQELRVVALVDLDRLISLQDQCERRDRASAGIV
jgi:hypothetical protein